MIGRVTRFMKLGFAIASSIAGLLAIAPVARGQYVSGQPGSHEIRFRPFAISFGTTSGYDSEASVFTKSQAGAQSSFYAGFNASAALNYIFADSFLGARMSTGYTYYFTRTVQPYDTTININSTFQHTFSPRWNMSISDSFVVDNEQQIGVNSELPGTAQQFNRQGEYYVNNFSLNNGFLLAPRLNLNLGLSYGLTRYRNTQAANSQDRDEYGVNLGPSYQLTSATSVGFSLSYSHSQHPGPTKIFAPSPPAPPHDLVDRVNRNSSQEGFSVNLNHTFSSRLSTSLSLGVTVTSFQDGHVTGESINPSVSAAATYVLDPSSTLALGYIHSISESQIPNFTATIQDTASISLTRRFTPKIAFNVNVSYSRNEFDQQFNASTAASVQANGNEEAISGSISTGYNFTNNLGLDLGYSYTKVLSDFNGRGFDRDRATLNLRFTF